MEDSDEEDDTAIHMAACGEAPQTPPAGFKYAPCPPLVSLDDMVMYLVTRGVACY